MNLPQRLKQLFEDAPFERKIQKCWFYPRKQTMRLFKVPIFFEFLIHYVYAGATERFLFRGVQVNKKKSSKIFLIYKSLILGGVRPPQTPPGPRPLIISTNKYWVTFVFSFVFLYSCEVVEPLVSSGCFGQTEPKLDLWVDPPRDLWFLRDHRDLRDLSSGTWCSSKTFCPLSRPDRFDSSLWSGW